MADIFCYHLLGPRFCDEPLGFLKNEIIAGNPFAVIFALSLAAGAILFIWADWTYPNAANDSGLNFILLVYMIYMLLLGVLMRVFKKRLVQPDEYNGISMREEL